MSSKSTLLLLPCCHIYTDCIGANGGDTLCIEVSYGQVEDECDFIEVEASSDFGQLIKQFVSTYKESE
tara:strand:- start:1229 stop:1432 length:204 start_codon:yes stop_codon:yes gene_type:complete